jgi:D-ribose pyranose/furanose isomerase RbsD
MKIFKRLETGLTEKGLIWLTLLIAGCTRISWQERLDSELTAFGHRNWIVIADAAYPKQSAQGIETIVTGEDQLEVLTLVLKKIKDAKHVKALVFLDSELRAVPEKDAPGVEAYRTHLMQLLQDNPIMMMPHEQIISKLDEASRLFHVLLLKTNMTLPYTSVFLQLDCGYWTEEKEKRLRNHLGEN